MMSIDEINKLQEENKQLRELYRLAKSLYKEQKQENKDLAKCLKLLDKPKIEVVDAEISIELWKYKQTLQEIKEKLIHVNQFCTAHEGIYDDNCIKVLVSTILDIINKAEEE